MKEDGQTLLHTTNTWAEKTMSMTNSEGREKIQMELSCLQKAWDRFLASLSNSRMSLQSALLQWNDFDDNHDHIQKWLRDTERRLSNSESKADLGEKRAQLQKMKVRK